MISESERVVVNYIYASGFSHIIIIVGCLASSTVLPFNCLLAHSTTIIDQIIEYSVRVDNSLCQLIISQPTTLKGT